VLYKKVAGLGDAPVVKEDSDEVGPEEEEGPHEQEEEEEEWSDEEAGPAAALLRHERDHPEELNGRDGNDNDDTNHNQEQEEGDKPEEGSDMEEDDEPEEEGEEEEDAMELFVKLPSGMTIALKVNASDTIWTVKVMIRVREHYPMKVQRIIFAGAQLEDNRTLSDYNITGGRTLQLQVRARGGAGAKRPRVIVDATPENSYPEPIKAIFAYADTFQCPKTWFKGLRPEEKESYNEFLQKAKNNERMVEGTVQRSAPVAELKAPAKNNKH
jgi:hypothetical protein